MAFSVEYIYRIIDRFSGPLSKITQNTNKFQAAMEKSSAKVNKIGGRLDSIGSRMANIGSVIGGAGAIAGIVAVTKSASNMEDAMGDVSRVTGMTGKNLENFESNLDKMARQTGKSTIGLAAIATAGGKLGTPNDQLLKFVTTVSKAAAAFDMTDEEAGDSIGSIQAKLGLGTDAVDTLLQRVNYLADNTASKGKDMINIIERTSGTFKMLKIPPEATAGWASFANQMEVSSELAASGLNMMMSRMMKIPGMMPKMLKDPQNAVKDFLGKFAKIPEVERGQLIIKTFGEEAGRFVMRAVTSMEKLDEAMKIAASNKALGSMDREFANIMARSSTLGKRLLAILSSISKAVGKVFLDMFDKAFPVMEKISMFVFNFVKAHPGLVKIAGVLGLILAGIVGVAVPVGLLFSVLAAGAPILAAITAAIAAISLPFVVGAAAVMALITMFSLMWKNSTMLRGAFANLADAFSPVTNGIKQIATAITRWFGGSLTATGKQMGSWGNGLAYVINGIAAIIKTAFSILDRYFKIYIPLICGDFAGAWEEARVAIQAFSDFFTPILDFWAKEIGKLLGAFDKLTKLNMSGLVKGAGSKLADWGKGALSFVGVGNDAAKNKTETTKNTLADWGKGALSFVGIGNDAAKNKTETTKNTLAGSLHVVAEPGTRVTRATANLNGGSNIATVN